METCQFLIFQLFILHIVHCNVTRVRKKNKKTNLKISFFVVISVSWHCLQHSDVHWGGRGGKVYMLDVLSQQYPFVKALWQNYNDPLIIDGSNGATCEMIPGQNDYSNSLKRSIILHYTGRKQDAMWLPTCVDYINDFYTSFKIYFIWNFWTSNNLFHTADRTALWAWTQAIRPNVEHLKGTIGMKLN